MAGKSVYSVGQVNSYIAGLFEEDFLLRNLCVVGETSNVKYHTSGHIYFTLKDKDGEISAVMFRGSRNGLSFPMKDGDRVVVTGSISVYEKAGRYQIYARKIEPQGEGTLFRLFEELKKELLEMGMFDPMYKKPIPKYAKTVGIVTAPTGAAVRDIIRISKRRNPYIRLILYPAKVQGEGAAESVAEGIARLDALSPDVIIVGRGGGSIEDLWAFNERIVADAIFQCETPVISAVGHETDTTIADFAADLRASTPSAAAELAVFEFGALEERLRSYEDGLSRAMEDGILRKKERLQRYRTTFSYLSPERMLKERRRQLVEKLQRMNLSMERKLEKEAGRVRFFAGRLEGLSPLKRLQAGYSFTEQEDGRPLRSVKEVSPGDSIFINVADGRVKAEVMETVSAGESE